MVTLNEAVYAEDPGIRELFSDEKECLMIMQKNGQKKGHVLIVDGDVWCGVAISFLFEDYGFTVSHADSGEEALSMITENKNDYDLVFLDLELPEMNGFKLINELRDRHIDVPVFVVSGFEDKIMFIEMLNNDCKKDIC